MSIRFVLTAPMVVVMLLGTGCVPTATLLPTAQPTATPSLPLAVPAAQVLFTARDAQQKMAIYAINDDGHDRRKLALGWSPAPSPDGQRLAYVDDGDIWVLYLASGEKRHLTSGPDWDDNPVWSPDGQRLAYASSPAGNPKLDIWVMDADGRNRLNLSQGSGVNWAPAWSPDGKKLAFAFSPDGNDSAICVINADGSGLTRLIRSGAEGLGVPGVNPQWSPDGTRILFVSVSLGMGQPGAQEPPANPDIAVMNADGSNFSLLTTEPCHDLEPVWTPDSRIAFVSDRGGGYDLHVMDADGSNVTRLTDLKAERGLTTPFYSPDGDEVVFVADEELYVMGSDGSNLTSLVNKGYPVSYGWLPYPSAPPAQRPLATPASAEEAALTNLRPLTTSGLAWFGDWAPNGGSLVYTVAMKPPLLYGRWPGWPEFEVWWMRADGSGPRRLAQGHSPFFSADGRTVFFLCWPLHSGPELCAVDVRGGAPRCCCRPGRTRRCSSG